MAAGGIWDSPFPPDITLDAKVVASPYETGKNQIVIDGSIYDDKIEIQQYTPGISNDLVKVRLSRWDGQNLLSTQTVTLSGGKLGATWPLMIKGKEGADTITNLTSLNMNADGGSGGDTIQAGSGGSYILGGSGYDYLFGGASYDTIRGGDDRDIIFGMAGDDFLYGEGGHDDIYGDFGDNRANVVGVDKIWGGAGDDLIKGDAGADELYGEDGWDRIWGGFGDDKAWGGAGNDEIRGEQGKDKLWGEGDVDKLYGGDDDDFLDGGNGGSSGSLSGVDYLEGGAGRDTFTRHISVFWGVYGDDGDIFGDFNSALGDSVNNVYHW
jgi:Ca2+-binding RTX toxin-like protein